LGQGAFPNSFTGSSGNPETGVAGHTFFQNWKVSTSFLDPFPASVKHLTPFEDFTLMYHSTLRLVSHLHGESTIEPIHSVLYT